MVEEDERADHAPFRKRQHPADFEATSEIAASLLDDHLPCPIVVLRMLLGTRGDCECEKSRPIFTLAYAIALSKRESAFASPELRSIGDARTTRANAGR
jgi:hypothetical protein